jgi:hypothetical protein
MQANNNNITNVHVKVEYNQEFRRFVVETISFEHLEKTLRTLLNIDSAQPVKILFLDDEKDWVLIASDSELAYAWELSASLLRLSVKAVPASVLAPVTVNHPEVFTHHPFHNARGRGCHGRGAGCRAGRVGRGDPTMRAQFMDSKLARLTERHAMLTAKLPEMPEERARALAWRISHLENKIEKITWKKESFAAHLAEQPKEETPAEKVTEEPAAAEEEPSSPARGFRGRGCRRGGRGGSHRWMAEGAESHPQFDAVMAKKVELKAARQGGNKEEIQAKWEALQEAKDAWREAKRAQLIARKQTQ